MGEYGRTTSEVNKSWSQYDKDVAATQMTNYGKVYLDEYGCPIDNEYEIDELRKAEAC